MSAYTEHRARRMWAAQDYEGWDLPPYPWPEEITSEPRMIGRVVMADQSRSTTKTLTVIAAGFYPEPVHREITDHFKAKEKRQNRLHFL